MAFDAEITANWGTALADLRDKVGGLTNWSVKDDSSGGAAALSTGDYFVLTSASPNEDLKIEVTPQGGLTVEHGTDWDATNDVWNSRFDFDPEYTRNDGGSTDHLVAPATINYGGGETVDMTVAGSYWLEYVDGSGFGFYFQREAGDGDDTDLFLGMTAIEKAWDYSTASETEAQWALSFGDGSNWTQVYMSMSGHLNSNDEPVHDGGNNDYEGRGMINPDNNFSNYPLTNTIVSSSQYKNIGGDDAIIGDFDTWVRDDSGSETGHKDLIQDGSQNDIYTILTRSGMNIALRMD